MPVIKPRNTASRVLDANIFVRFLVSDGPSQQREKCRGIFESIESSHLIGLVHTVTIHEVLYVLMHVYSVTKNEAVSATQKLLDLANIKVLDLSKKSLRSALTAFARHPVDFPDCLLAEICKKEELPLLTFDADFKKLGVRVEDEVPF